MQLLFDKEKNNIRCVLPGTSLPLGKNGEYLERFFKDNYDINVEYLVEAKTVPGKGHMHNRIDQIFTVQEDSVEKFAKIKNEMNAEYAKEKNNIRCVLPGTSLPLGKNGEYLERFFKDNYDINVEYLVEAKTVPGKGHMHNRIDQIFTVQEDSVEKFAKIKNEMNAEYAK